MKHRNLAHKLLAASVAMAFLAPAHAVLERAGPVNNAPTVGGYPAWFQDKTGITIEFCDLTSQVEYDGGWCTLIPPGPVFPESFPDNFFDEHFYYRVDTSVTDGTTKARLVLAVEAAFATGPVIPGDQMTFGRERVFITNVPFAGTYTVYYPYGKFVFDDVAAGDRIFFTQDVGLSCIATFECTLNTGLGPYALPSPTPGGVELPPIPDLVLGQDPAYDALIAAGGTTQYPGNGKKYLADPGRLGPITGSPLPPYVGNDGVTYNHNTFRVEGPNGFVLHTQDFTVNGRLVDGPLVGRVVVDRASYAQTVASATGKKLDVFVTGDPTVSARMPTQPTPPAIVPELLFFGAPCTGTLDPATGEILPPFSAPAGASPTQMVSAGNKYWAQTQPAAIPTAVCVEDTNSRNLAGQVVPTFYNKLVADEVTPAGGSGATYNPAGGGTLSLSVKSSDTLFPPVLTSPYGALAAGALSVSPLAAPPSTVQVKSSEGGVTELLVQTAVGAAGGGTPIAFNDDLTINEDCSPTAASACATPLVISPLANDTFNGGPIPAGAVVTITATPRLGTAVLNANNTITYTPNSNANGSDSLSYTVSVGGTASNTGIITVNVTPINDLPVAVNDTLDAVTGKSNRYNLIANDTDVDGVADLANAQIVTWPPQLGATPTPVGGVVTFSPTTTGTFTATYRAVDAAGALSANTANVSVVVANVEAIVPGGTLFRARVGNAGQSRWVVDGTDSVRQGETLSMVYANGTLSAAQGGGSCNGTLANPKCLVGTAVVDGTGAYLLDVTFTPGGPQDPTSTTAWATRPTQLRTFSSNPVLGGSATTAIQVK